MSIICLLQDAKLVSSSLSLLTKDTKVLLPPPFTNVSFWKKVWKPASACLLSQNLICFPRRKIPLVNLKLEKKLFFRLQWVLSFSKCMQIFNQIEAWRMWILTLPKIFLQFFQLRLFLDFLSFFQTLWTTLVLSYKSAGKKFPSSFSTGDTCWHVQLWNEPKIETPWCVLFEKIRFFHFSVL